MVKVRGRSLNRKTARAIPNVRDQPESFRYRWPTAMNLIQYSKNLYAQSNSRPFRSLEFLTPGTSDVIFATENFAAFFGYLFDRVPVRILTFTIQPHEKKKSLQDQRIWFWSAVWSNCNCGIRELFCITSFCLFYTLSFWVYILNIHDCAWPKIMFSLWVVSDLWIRCRIDHLPLVCNRQ